MIFASQQRRRRRRGFAMLDYMAGSVILVSALATVTSMNMTKFRLLSTARKRQLAIYAGNSVLELAADHFSKASNFANIQTQLKSAGSATEWVKLPPLENGQSYLGPLGRRAAMTLRARSVKNGAVTETNIVELNIEVRWWHTKTSSSAITFSTIIRKAAS